MDAAPALFDTHVHLDALDQASLQGKLAEARKSGVELFLVPGVRREGWPDLLELARSHRGVWAAPGLHPLAARQWGEATAAALSDLLEEREVAAVGEIGLDLLLPDPPPAVQEEALRGQLRLAVSAGKPVLVHCRKAIGRLLTLLRKEGADRAGGILHAFSGSPESALEATRLGFAIGFGGTLTWPGSRRAPEVLAALPPEWIVLETDAPDLAPHPHRGEDNRPAWLSLVADKVGEIRGWDRETTARITTANAKRVLGLTPDAGSAGQAP